MRRLTSIVAVNRQGVIGAGNALPWRVRSDMMFFKAQTINNVVIMGRKTYDSLGKCLPNRHNIIVTHNLSLFERVQGCSPVCSIDEALYQAEAAPKKYKELFVVGGATMYAQFAPYVGRYLITLIDKTVDHGDTYLGDVFGDLERWNIRLLQEGSADGVADEASYEILELTAKDESDRFDRREEVVEAYRERVEKNRGSRTRSRLGCDSDADRLQGFGF